MMSVAPASTAHIGVIVKRSARLRETSLRSTPKAK